MQRSRGFTVPELIVTIVVFAIISSSIATIIFAYVGSSADGRLRSSALTVASQQVERLRSLPYDGLAVVGGSITGVANPIPATEDFVRAGRTYTATTDIRYVDDAFDGCLDYGASQVIYCKNYTASTVLSDTNPRDYKVATVSVTAKGETRVLASLSTHFTSRITETTSNSAAILVRVLDSTGSPVNGAQVRIRNLTLSPRVDQSAVTDVNGQALFLDVPPDNNKNYVVSTSKSGYSSLTTIAQNGALIPKYPNVNAIAQKVSNVTLLSDVVSSQSLQIQTVDPAGNPVPNVSVSVRGGIKQYTNPDDTTYSQIFTVSTDASGITTLNNLTPGIYQVCYLSDPNTCSTTTTMKALSVWVAYGAASTQPFSVPAGAQAADGGPVQRIMVTVSPSSSAPRISAITPSIVSVSSPDAATTELTITGQNLSEATVTLQRATQADIPSTVSGTDSSSSIKRVFNMAGIPQGAYDVVITTSDGTVRQKGLAPGTLGGVNVAQ